MTMETSKSVYEELFNTLSPKAMKSLTNIKKACDIIVTTRGIINYSQVGKIATVHFGSPKIQSIQNNKSLKRYIDARLNEYHNKVKSHSLPDSNQKVLNSNEYPAPNLDSRTKTYIDQLRLRNNILDNVNKELKNTIKNITKSDPINIANAIATGADNEGNLEVDYTESNEHLFLVQQILLNVFSLVDFMPDIVVDVQGGKKSLILKREMGDIIIINPKQMRTVNSLLNHK